jgi:hypothetical protein
MSFIPKKVRTGGIEPPQPGQRGYSPVSSPLLSVRLVRVTGRPRTGAAGFTVPDASALHHGHHDGDDGTRTRDPSLDKRQL